MNQPQNPGGNNPTAVIPLIDPTTPQPVQEVRLLRFVGSITWEGRSNGLPEEIYDFVAYDGRAPQQVLLNIIGERLQTYQKAGGMTVQADQGAPIDVNATIADRVLVPYSMIVTIKPELWPIPGPAISLPDEQGIERYPSGKAAPVN